MPQSQFIKKMSELEDKIYSKEKALKFAELLTECDDIGGEIKGFLFLLEERANYLRLDKRFGDGDLYIGEMNLRGTPEEIEEDRKNQEQRVHIEKVETIYRFADIIKPFGFNTWTPEIKAKFENGLKYLEGLVKGGA